MFGNSVSHLRRTGFFQHLPLFDLSQSECGPNRRVVNLPSRAS
jgi:hypothetical protein